MRLRWTVVLAATLATAGSLASPALAADRRVEAAAKEALKKAADDYLGTDYAAGAARLQRALRVCGASKCTVATRALLLRDLGTMQFRSGDLGASKRSWAEARKLQSDLPLNADYETPDLRAAWDEGNGAAPASSAGAEQPSGDFTHTPPVEQKVNTPLPVYVEYPGNSTVARVIVKYRGPKASDWQRADLKRMGSGWGGVIPCGDVSRGAMRYWIQGFDDGGDPIASSGDPKHPYTVPIKDDIAGDAPHLPGKAPPKTCGESSPEETPAESETEAPKRKGTPEGHTYARVWIGVSAELPEFVQMPSGDDLCKLNASAGVANSAGAYCTTPGGSDFPSRATPAQNNNLTIQGQAGHSDGGLQPGDIRVMAAFDYALSASFLVGARLGYVFNAYPGQAAVSAGHALGPKIHAEARATYLFGDEPLAHTGFAPMVFAGTGISEFDAHVSSAVSLDNVAGQQPVNIWVTDAPFFIALGGGVRYQFSLRAAFTAAVRLNAVIGGNGFMMTYGPELGVVYGF
jgi:putative hemolysin